VDLWRTLPSRERYSYVFQGNAQALDHVLVSPHLARRRPALDAVHVTAAYADQVSDHDPLVARLKPHGRRVRAR